MRHDEFKTLLGRRAGVEVVIFVELVVLRNQPAAYGRPGPVTFVCINPSHSYGIPTRVLDGNMSGHNFEGGHRMIIWYLLSPGVHDSLPIQLLTTQIVSHFYQLVLPLFFFAILFVVFLIVFFFFSK